MLNKERIVCVDECPAPKKGQVSAEVDIKEYLKSPPQQKADSTPLNHDCQCPKSPPAKRYQCLNCIRQWVESVCPHLAHEETIRLRLNGYNFAAQRIVEAVEQKRLRKAMHVDSSTHFRCRDCSSGQDGQVKSSS